MDCLLGQNKVAVVRREAVVVEKWPLVEVRLHYCSYYLSYLMLKKIEG